MCNLFKYKPFTHFFSSFFDILFFKLAWKNIEIVEEAHYLGYFKDRQRGRFEDVGTKLFRPNDNCCRHLFSFCQQNRDNPSCSGSFSKVCSCPLPFDVRPRTCRKSLVLSSTRRAASGDGLSEPGSQREASWGFSVLSCTGYCSWSINMSGTSRPIGQHCESVLKYFFSLNNDVKLIS